ncbi:MAG: hypothetical protein D6770_05350 [Anaerolineae bacterium]|nr:MAG: hypothetical protein D6770_05350 [Anaerolineae bacterium]
MKAVLDLPEPHARALEIILERVPPDEVPWALTGSAGMRLQGVDVPVHDLDLQSDARGVRELEARLSDFMRQGVREWVSERTRSLDGKAEIEGVSVELIGDICHRAVGGEWSAPPDVAALRVFVEWRSRRVPVMPLEHEAEAYERMGRLEKAALLREAIRRREEAGDA